MERKRRLPLGPGGQRVAVTELGYRAAGEYWNECLLDDGTVARLKLVVSNVYRIDGQTYHISQPRYWIEAINVMAISASGEAGI